LLCLSEDPPIDKNSCTGAFNVPVQRKIPEADIIMETRKGAALSCAPAQIAVSKNIRFEGDGSSEGCVAQNTEYASSIWNFQNEIHTIFAATTLWSCILYFLCYHSVQRCRVLSSLGGMDKSMDALPGGRAFFHIRKKVLWRSVIRMGKHVSIIYKFILEERICLLKS